MQLLHAKIDEIKSDPNWSAFTEETALVTAYEGIIKEIEARAR